MVLMSFGMTLEVGLRGGAVWVERITSDEFLEAATRTWEFREAAIAEAVPGSLRRQEASGYSTCKPGLLVSGRNEDLSVCIKIDIPGPWR